MSTSGGWQPAAAQATPPPPGTAGAGTLATAGGTGAALAAPPSPGTTAASGSAVGQTGAPAASDAALPARLGSADVPTALARWQVVLTAAVVVWALLTTALLLTSFDKTRSGAADTAQLTRIHAMESDLFQADALATNAFLVGGQEPAEQRMAYDAALDRVSRLIIDAAEAQPADRAALAALNRNVLTYAEQMQQARANNRQGLPVGAQYLQEASDQLRVETLAILDALVDANEQRATAAFSGHLWPLVILPGLALLLLLGWFNQQLAEVFRRRINVGLAIAALVVAAVTVAAAVVIGTLASDADDLRNGDFAAAVSIAAARTAANDAKANESLGLIARGSGERYETGWQEAAERVTENIAGSGSLTDHWDLYTEGHADIVAADEAGDWESAVAVATSSEPEAPSAHFRNFDEAAAAEVDMAGQAVSSVLQAGSWRAGLAAIATLLGMVAAVWALSTGLTARRREFS